jgi:hypothetical protein
MSVVAFSVVAMSKRDRTRRRIGECMYEICAVHTDDGRIDLSLVACDDDGQVVAELAGTLPAAHVPAIGKLISRSRTGLPTYDVARIRERHPNAYARWAPEDDERLARLFGEGLTVDLLAAEFGRNYGAIRSRLNKLGLLDTWIPEVDLGRAS